MKIFAKYQTFFQNKEIIPPYDIELYQIDCLLKYLNATYPIKTAEVKEATQSELVGEWAGMSITTRKNKDDHYVAPTAGKKTKGKKVGEKKPKKIILDPIMIEWYSDFNMLPPTTSDRV